MNASLYTIELGHESDGELVAHLQRTVIACGGSMTLAAHDVGGMEESICYDIALPEGELEAVAETGLPRRSYRCWPRNSCLRPDLSAHKFSQVDQRISSIRLSVSSKFQIRRISITSYLRASSGGNTE
jgi:hypothetical protein